MIKLTLIILTLLIPTISYAWDAVDTWNAIENEPRHTQQQQGTVFNPYVVDQYDRDGTRHYYEIRTRVQDDRLGDGINEPGSWQNPWTVQEW